MKNPPAPKKQPVTISKHGHERTDDYYWLRERENPEVLKHLQKENEYYESEMADTKELREDLFKEIVGRIKQTDVSVPYKYNGYYYYTRFEEGKEYPVYCRKKESLSSPEEIMIDVNELAKGFAYYELSSISVSPDNRLLAYGEDTLSRRVYTLYFKDLTTGKLLDDVIRNTGGNAVWAADNRTVFYSVKDEQTLRSYRIFRHRLGREEDNLVYQEDDETYVCGVAGTKSRKYIFIGSYAKTSSEYRFIESGDPEAEFRVMEPRRKDHEYDISHYGDKFYIVTNLDAKNFRLMETPVSAPGQENWKELIPHREDVFLDDVEIFRDHLVVTERENGLIKLRIFRWDDMSDSYYLDFGEEAYLAYTSANPDFNTTVLRYGYTSMTTPNSIFDFDMMTREKTLLKQQEIPGGFNPADYETKRLYAIAGDGEKIPVSMVYRKGMQKNGANPLLLYGYGSYGITIDPSFSSSRLSLLDRGFIFAIAHIRGGQVKGRRWYEEGKLLKKMNTFTDFIACSEFMINEGYTSPQHLYAMGGSAGGLLIGAVINMRPDLYHGVVAQVPFVDVLTTMLDDSIPLTTGEYDEWGDPNKKEYYDYILQYSPYDNVSPQEYPNVFVATGLHDSQVQYWEPAKWVAKLRDMNTGQNKILMYVNLEAGHGGASGRFEVHRETARVYAFLLSR